MKKIVILGIILVVVANAFTIYYVNQQMLGMKQTVSGLKNLSIKLPPEFEDRLEGDLRAVVAGVKTSTDTAVATIEPAVKSVVEGMDQTVKNAKRSADNAVAELSPTMKSAIVGIESNIVDMCRSRVLGNEIEADLSYQKAVQALDAGDVALAKLYCMNAINHSPTKKLYFEKLVEISGKADEETRDDLEQIKGALELGLFQVASTDVSGMRDMLARVIEKIGNIDANAVSARQDEEKMSNIASLKILREGDLRYESVIATGHVERVALLQRRLVLLQGVNKESLASNDIAWVEREDGRTRIALEYYSLVNSTDLYLTRAEKMLESDPTKMNSINLMVQTASQSLSQALGIDTSSMPDTSASEVHKLAKRIEAIEISFNQIKSAPAVTEVKVLLAKADAVDVSAPYQEKINDLDACLAEIAQKIVMVYDADIRNALEIEIKKVSAKIGQCRQAQYKAYQSWAIGRCKDGMDKYRSWIRVDIKDAKEVVNDFLIDIDPTLLTPDVTRLYQDVLGKQFAELKKETVSVEIDLAKHAKKQLSDF